PPGAGLAMVRRTRRAWAVPRTSCMQHLGHLEWPVFLTRRVRARRGDEHSHPFAAFRAIARRIEEPATRTIAFVGRATAPDAEHDQSALESAPMGMRRSSSIWRSSAGERPSVVR